MKLVFNFISVFVGIQSARYFSEFLFEQAYSLNSMSISFDLLASLVASLAIGGIDKLRSSKKR
jgi:hypothetical protein